MAKEEEVKEPSPDPKEDAEDTTEPEEEAEPEFVCGVIIRQLPNGQGLHLEAIESGEFSRKPTLTDLIGMAKLLASHAEGLYAADKIMDVLGMAGVIKMPRKRGIIH